MISDTELDALRLSGEKVRVVRDEPGIERREGDCGCLGWRASTYPSSESTCR